MVIEVDRAHSAEAIRNRIRQPSSISRRPYRSLSLPRIGVAQVEVSR
jgi:hypothetical protein